MWLNLLRRSADDCAFAPPPTADRFAAAERALGIALPAHLRELLSESDGVTWRGAGLVWPIGRIEADNIAFRSNADFRELYMPFGHLLFFADAANGDQFAFPVLAGRVPGADIFAWDHENDSRYWVAPSLPTYLEWVLSGRINL